MKTTFDNFGIFTETILSKQIRPMNFIYSIIFFLALSAGSRLLSSDWTSAGSGDYIDFFGVLMYIFAIVATVFAIVGFFNNLVMRTAQKDAFHGIRERVKDIERKRNMIPTYKKEMQELLTKTYPDYERDILKGIPAVDAESINNLIMKYPDLKFSGVLTTFTANLTQMIHKIEESQSSLDYCLRHVADRQENDWFFVAFHPKTPADIKELLTK